MKLSRTEICKRVPMSLATFDRWRKLGKLEAFTDDTLSYAKKHIVWVTMEALGKALGIEDEVTLRQRLGLPQVQPDPLPEPDPLPKQKPQRVPDISEPGAFEPHPVDPETYRDSFGHTILGNDHHKMFGPTQLEPKVDLQAHMNPALLGNTGSGHNPVDSDAFRDLWRPHGAMTCEERRRLMKQQISPEHPNATRQAFLSTIFRDIGKGYSR